MILAVLAALVVVTGMLGCKKDDTAVKALQELTNQQLDAVKTANTELTQLAEGIESCQAEVAKTKGEAAIIKTKEVALETPELVGEASVESLNALKAALAETTKKQTTAMSELKAAQEACAADLTEAKEAAEAAAADAAAEAEAAAAAEAEAAAQGRHDSRQEEGRRGSREEEGRRGRGQGKGGGTKAFESSEGSPGTGQADQGHG